MKRICLLFAVFVCFAVINTYATGGKDQTIDAHIAEITELTNKVNELERDQKALKEELDKNRKDMDGLARKLEGAGDVPEISQRIILPAGQNGYLKQDAVVDFMVKYSRPPSWFGREDIETIVSMYFREAQKERVNMDIALAQMWYATQSLTHHQLLLNCNYANLEPICEEEGIKDWNGVFTSSETGVRAHIQHLKGYASTERPENIIDPRYEILAKNNYLGKGDTIDKLCAIWTKDTSGRYENGLNEILKAMYQHQNSFTH